MTMPTFFHSEALPRHPCAGLPDCCCMAAVKKRCATGCWRQGVAKLLSERTKAFVHTISERKKSGRVAPLPPSLATQHVAVRGRDSGDVALIEGAAQFVCLPTAGGPWMAS